MTTKQTPKLDAVKALTKTLSFCNSNLDPYAILSDLKNQGYTITRAESAPLPDDVEAALERLKLAAEEMPQEDDYYFEAAARDDKILRAHIAELESKITTLRNAAEIGLTYVLAAQRGLTFTKPRMASDVEVFNDALKIGGDE